MTTKPSPDPHSGVVLRRKWRRFAADETGATMIEYALIVAFLVILTVSSVSYFGNKLNNSYGRIGNAFN